MSYQNVGTPKFYINALEWYYSTGIIDELSDTLRTLPINLKSMESFNITGLDMFNVDFLAILGHKLNSEERTFQLATGHQDSIIDHAELVNLSNSGIAEYNGFSIVEFDSILYNNYWFIINDWDQGTMANIGSIVIGNTYDMLNSPNLSLTVNQEYDGTKTLSTNSGGSISNSMWSRPPKWGDLGAWELSPDNSPRSIIFNKLSKSGRRSWDLKFSYIDDSNLWGSNQSLSQLQNTDVNLDVDDQTHLEWIPVHLDNGDFSSSLSGTWFTIGSPTINASNQCVLSNYGGLGNVGIYQQNQLEFNKDYKLVYDLIDATSGEVSIDLGLDEAGLGTTVGNDLELYFNSKNAPNFGTMFSINRVMSTVTTSVTIDNLRLYVSNSTGFSYNLLTDDNFFSQVWHKTLGGTLPFIFQPDSNNNNPDQFAICKFKNNSLKATQSAFNVYDVSISIEEVW